MQYFVDNGFKALYVYSLTNSNSFSQSLTLSIAFLKIN